MARVIRQDEYIDPKQIAFIQKCRINYVFAALMLLNLDLFIWQKAMLYAMQSGRFVMIIAGRGLGKTFTMAIYAVLKGMLNRREKIGIISYSYRQAKFVFAEIQRLYEECPHLRAACDGEPSIGSDKCILRFKNGSYIMALPLGDGQKIRGARFYTVIGDEAVKLPEDILKAVVMPMMNVKKDPSKKKRWARLKRMAEARGESFNTPDGGETAGNQIILATTAWFQFAFLYKEFVAWGKKEAEGNKHYKVLTFTYLDALEDEDAAEYLDVEAINMQKETMSPVLFAMENLGYWPPDTDGFFKRSYFEKARGSFAVQSKALNKKEEFVLGIDPARESDNFVITVEKRTEAGGQLVYVEAIEPGSIDDTDAFSVMHYRIREIFRAFGGYRGQVKRVALDAGGGGLPIRDSLSKPFEYISDEGITIIEPAIMQILSQNDMHDEVVKRHQIDSKIPRPLQVVDLISWSSEWINKSAWHLRSMLENRRLMIASYNREGDDEKNSIETKLKAAPTIKFMVDVRDEIQNEIEETIKECTTILATPLPTKKGMFRFDVPDTVNKDRNDKKKLKKDRWASLMLATRALLDLEEEGMTPPPQIAGSGVASSQELVRINTQSYEAPAKGSRGVSRLITPPAIPEIGTSADWSTGIASDPYAAALRND